MQLTTTLGITAADYDPTVTAVHAYCEPQAAIELHERILAAVPADERILRNSIAAVFHHVEQGTYVTEPPPVTVLASS